MLDTWIIEELEELNRNSRPVLELPLVQLPAAPDPSDGGEAEERGDGERRGVIVIDMT